MSTFMHFGVLVMVFFAGLVMGFLLGRGKNEPSDPIAEQGDLSKNDDIQGKFTP